MRTVKPYRKMRPSELIAIHAKLGEVLIVKAERDPKVASSGVVEYPEGWSDTRVADECTDKDEGFPLSPKVVAAYRVKYFGKFPPRSPAEKAEPEAAQPETPADLWAIVAAIEGLAAKQDGAMNAAQHDARLNADSLDQLVAAVNRQGREIEQITKTVSAIANGITQILNRLAQGSLPLHAPAERPLVPVERLGEKYKVRP